jgi:hypothetical protein
LRPLIAWYGTMTMAPHLWTVVGLGTIEIVVEFHPSTTLADCGSRKALARYCQERVTGGLANALSGRRGAQREARRAQAPLPAPADAAAPVPG